MAKQKPFSFSDALVISVVLIGIVASVAGMNYLLNYIGDGGTSSSSDPIIKGQDDINVYVDGELSNGNIVYDNVNDFKTFEIRNKSNNAFYSQKVTYQTTKPESFQITDLNGDDLYVRAQIKILAEEYIPVKVFVVSSDFMFYVLLSLKGSPATSIGFGSDLTFIE